MRKKRRRRGINREKSQGKTESRRNEVDDVNVTAGMQRRREAKMRRGKSSNTDEAEVDTGKEIDKRGKGE